MKRLFIVLLIFFVTGCTGKRDKARQVFYFYNDVGEFSKSQTREGIFFSMRLGWGQIDWNYLPLPSMEKKPCTYYLNYFNGDTTFRKQKSYLDSIRCYDVYWMTNDSNLQDFWTKKRYGSSARKDTLEIYLIEKIASTDSVLFRRVQRIFGEAK